MRFADIPGQEIAKEALRNPVDCGQVPHAIMISGPAGSGKMMLARAFAQYLHCDNPHDGEPCGRCNNCRLHEELNHPDLLFYYPTIKLSSASSFPVGDRADEWKQMIAKYPSMPFEKWQELINAENKQPIIYVNDAAHIVRTEALSPSTASRKVFIIWLPERMNLDAANKLLKVIEEPAESTLFLLVSNNELGVLPTIFSRVRRIHAGRFSDPEIRAYLEHKYGFDSPTAMKYSHLCNGSLIRADEFGGNSGENEEFLALYQNIMRAAYAKKVIVLRQLGDKVAATGREKTRRFLDYMSRMFRENFIRNLRLPPLSSMTPEEEDFSRKFSPFVNHTNIEEFLEQTDRAIRDIAGNGNAKVVLFDYFIYIIILLHRKPKA